MSGIKLCSSLGEAEKLYKKFVTSPKNALHTWETRRAMFDSIDDNVFFLYNERILIPLQLTGDGTIEWFGGYLIGDNNWLIYPSTNDSLSDDIQEELASFINVFSNIDNTINNICSPVYGYTDLSAFPTYHLKFSSYQHWFNSLDKDRKYELQQAKRTIEAHIASKICVEDLNVNLDLVTKMLEDGDDSDHTEAANDHFQKGLRRLLIHAHARSEVDVAFLTRIGDPDKEIIAIAFCFLDWINPRVYHWVFSAINADSAPFLDKCLIDSVVALANKRNENGSLVTKIIAPSDEIDLEAPAYSMGFSYDLCWCTKTMLGSYRSAEEEDEIEEALSKIAFLMKEVLFKFCTESVLTEALDYFENEEDPDIGLEIINAAIAVFSGTKINQFDAIEQYLLDNDIVEQVEEGDSI